MPGATAGMSITNERGSATNVAVRVVGGAVGATGCSCGRSADWIAREGIGLVARRGATTPFFASTRRGAGADASFISTRRGATTPFFASTRRGATAPFFISTRRGATTPFFASTRRGAGAGAGRAEARGDGCGSGRDGARGAGRGLGRGFGRGRGSGISVTDDRADFGPIGAMPRHQGACGFWGAWW